MTSDKYYLTKNGGETFEEMTLEEIGREVLTHDGRKYKVVAGYDFAVQNPHYDNHFDRLHPEFGISSDEVGLHVYEASKSDFEIDISGEVELLLLAKIGQGFYEAGTWDGIPDRWEAYDEESYQEELQFKKEQDK